MKARVKATGEIVEINESSTIYDARLCQVYNTSELENIPDTDTDYWTRLEHTYAGMAMQGMLSGWWTENIAKISYNDVEHFNLLTHKAKELAHTLVEKLKEKEERK